MRERCPTCGRFVSPQADGYYVRLEPENESSYIAACCDSSCAAVHYLKAEGLN